MAKKATKTAGGGADDFELSDKHERFCREYRKDHNATQAYLRTYPACTYATAKTNGNELLTKTVIRQKIDALNDAVNKRLELTKENVLRELQKLAFANAADLYDDDGRVKSIGELDRETSAAITGVEVVERIVGDGDALEITRKIKLADKRAALELLAKHLNLLGGAQDPDDETPPPVRVVIEVQDARKPE